MKEPSTSIDLERTLRWRVVWVSLLSGALCYPFPEHDHGPVSETLDEFNCSQ